MLTHFFFLRGVLLLFLGQDSPLPPPPTTNNTTTTSSSSSEILMSGTFYLHSSDNFDAYLTELGVGFILRQLASLAYPIVTVDRSVSS